MSNYTDGPWHEIDGAEVWSKNKLVAIPTFKHAPYSVHDIDEFKANRLLIAAAPDLLEACKRLLATYKYDAKEYGIGDISEYSAVRATVQAIAKAEGGQYE